MKALKLLTLGVAGAGLAASATAQFDGPTPLAWRWSPPSVEYSPSGAPVVDKGTVYVAAKNRIFALEANSGNEKWKFPLDGAKGTFRYQPLVAGDTIIDVTDAGYFYAANAADGALKWSYQQNTFAPMGQPVSVGNLVIYKLSNKTLNALSLETGQPVWEEPLPIPTGFNGPLLVHNDDVLFADNDNQMYSVNAVTKKINWKRSFGHLPPNLVPSLYGDNIYLYSGSYLVCLNVVKGFGKWQVNLGQRMEYGPAVSANGMMCATEDGQLFFFDLQGRRALREVVDLGSGPAAQPSAIGTKYLVPTNNGALNLVDPKTGKSVWVYAVRPIGGIAQKKDAVVTFDGKTLIDPRIVTIQAAGPAVLNGSTMMVMGVDASLLAFDPNIGVDLTPPDAEMLHPKPGAQVNGEAPSDLIFKVSDEATGINLSTLKVDVDGKELEKVVGRDGVVMIHLSTSGANKGLLAGRRTFTVSVADWMGNETKKTFSLMVDNTLPKTKAPTNLQPAGGRGKGSGAGIG